MLWVCVCTALETGLCHCVEEQDVLGGKGGKEMHLFKLSSDWVSGDHPIPGAVECREKAKAPEAQKPVSELQDALPWWGSDWPKLPCQ